MSGADIKTGDEGVWEVPKRELALNLRTLYCGAFLVPVGEKKTRGTQFADR